MTIEERVEKVEMELARAKRRNRLLLAVVLLALVLLAVGATTPGIGTLTTSGAIGGRENVVEANRFILVDVNNKTRATLSVGEDGPWLDLRDENGIPRIRLTVSKEGPGLVLRDENGQPRAFLAALKDGSALDLSDKNGKTRAFLAADKDGPNLTLLDENGKGRAIFGIIKTTTPDGKVISYPESSILLFNPDGKVLWQAPPLGL